MKLNEYLVEEEFVTAKVGAFANPDAVGESNKGTLACTPYRLVYVNGSDVTDISFQGVNSIEYSEPQYPQRYLNWGLAGIFGGLLIAAFGILVDGGIPIPNSAMWILSSIFVLAGVGVLVQGYLLRRGSLDVHTPNKTYTFTSDEDGLAEIGHTLRGYEMEKK
ncbi:hypothetical protein [Haloparvum sedimenti]|uniref:hypothetical protein n=1 Tax=Haloparvum sedimenti TaxID=1678448 RepID=UPI00071E9424|nr:hypothetical protein [Haloparvum sedimenti]